MVDVQYTPPSQLLCVDVGVFIFMEEIVIAITLFGLQKSISLPNQGLIFS